MVREHAHAGEIQLIRETPYNLGRNITQSTPGRIVGKHDAEENRPLAAPVLEGKYISI